MCYNITVRLTRPVGQAVKTLASHAGNMGSIPVRVTRTKHTERCAFFRSGDPYEESRPAAQAAWVRAPQERNSSNFVLQVIRKANDRFPSEENSLLNFPLPKQKSACKRQGALRRWRYAPAGYPTKHTFRCASSFIHADSFKARNINHNICF